MIFSTTIEQGLGGKNPEAIILSVSASTSALISSGFLDEVSFLDVVVSGFSFLISVLIVGCSDFTVKSVALMSGLTRLGFTIFFFIISKSESSELELKIK